MFAPRWGGYLAIKDVAVVFIMLACSFDASARQHRSAAAKHAFRVEHPCPLTGQVRGKCPGYVIDHIKPLACGGPDEPSNMQWQTTAEAKAKDRWERNQCKFSKKIHMSGSSYINNINNLRISYLITIN